MTDREAASIARVYAAAISPASGSPAEVLEFGRSAVADYLKLMREIANPPRVTAQPKDERLARIEAIESAYTALGLEPSLKSDVWAVIAGFPVGWTYDTIGEDGMQALERALGLRQP